jgi:hypothetical protein
MLFCKCKFLGCRELPPQDPYPPTYLISVLTGTDTRNYTGKREVFERLNGLDQLTDLFLELSDKHVRLEQYGGSGKGNAYRHSVLRVIDDPAEVLG